MYSIEEFIQKAIKQDERNIFKSYEEKIKGVPDSFLKFYKDYNPKDVEVSIQGSMVKFVPYECLKNIQKEYPLNEDCFIFATNNGAPIYEKKNKKICSCVFSKNGIIEEEIVDSFLKYLELID